jgi:hypothetical protein
MQIFATVPAMLTPSASAVPIAWLPPRAPVARATWTFVVRARTRPVTLIRTVRMTRIDVWRWVRANAAARVWGVLGSALRLEEACCDTAFAEPGVRSECGFGTDGGGERAGGWNSEFVHGRSCVL